MAYSAEKLRDAMKKLHMTPGEKEPLGNLINQVDEVHAELLPLLREPGLKEADYDQLWDAHEHISKALAIMVRVQRRGNVK